MKTATWESIRRRLKPRFQAAGLTRCELLLPGCWHDNALGFAHAKKRRHLSPAEFGVVILACTTCHQQIEFHKDMENIVLTTIAKRRVQPKPL